eukprot:m.156255 g.156255  ORF g.156255 m.156255 type:complete len:695 (+) comp23614_c0_seq1:173-2257(+)
MAAAALPMGQLPAAQPPPLRAASVYSGSQDQIDLWQFFVRHHHTWPSGLIPMTTPGNLLKFAELVRLEAFLKGKKFTLKSAQNQLRLLKDQVYPKVGVSVDISGDPSGTRQDLDLQVGGADGVHRIAHAAVDAILSSDMCTQAEDFLFLYHVVQNCRDQLVEYAKDIIVRLLDLLATCRAGKSTMIRANNATYQAQRRAMRSENDSGYELPADSVGGVSRDAPIYAVAQRAVDILRRYTARAAQIIADSSGPPRPEDTPLAPTVLLVETVGRVLGIAIQMETNRTLAHVLSPVKEIVVPPRDGYSRPTANTDTAARVYYCSGVLVVSVKGLVKFIENLKSRSERQNNLLRLAKTWIENVELDRTTAESDPNLPTQFCTEKAVDSAYDPSWPSLLFYDVVCRLEDMCTQAEKSGALAAYGADRLYTRIENTAIYDTGMRAAFKRTFRGAGPGSGERIMVRHDAPDDIPAGMAELWQFKVWVHQQASHDLWVFLMRRWINLRGKDHTRRVNASRSGQEKSLDGISHRTRVATGTAGEDTNETTSKSEERGRYEAFAAGLLGSGELNRTLFPEGADGTDPSKSLAVPEPEPEPDDDAGDDDLLTGMGAPQEGPEELADLVDTPSVSPPMALRAPVPEQSRTVAEIDRVAPVVPTPTTIPFERAVSPPSKHPLNTLTPPPRKSKRARKPTSFHDKHSK